MLDYANNDKQWYIATSVVNGPESLWTYTEHRNLESTRDGGLSAWLPEVNGKPMKKNGLDHLEEPLADSESHGKLRGHCHCKGVEFYISRPTKGSSDDLPASLRPLNPNKWYAVNDVCRTCRLSSGCAILQWAFPTIDHVTLLDGSRYRRIFGTLKEYRSSPGVSRTFCGRCGAIFAYHVDDRPKMVDIAVGLLDANSGARAEDWLEWRSHRVAFEEDVVFHDLVESLKKGLNSVAGKST